MIWPWPVEPATWRFTGPGPTAARQPRVLLVDDDLAIAQMYLVQLTADGFEVELAADGEEGLNRVRSQRPDLVLLDLRLPGLSGLQVLRGIRASAGLADLPVVILSNYSDAEMIRQGRLWGATEYLVKSATTPGQVSARVRALLPGA